MDRDLARRGVKDDGYETRCLRVICRLELTSKGSPQPCAKEQDRRRVHVTAHVGLRHLSVPHLLESGGEECTPTGKSGPREISVSGAVAIRQAAQDSRRVWLAL